MKLFPFQTGAKNFMNSLRCILGFPPGRAEASHIPFAVFWKVTRSQHYIKVNQMGTMYQYITPIHTHAETMQAEQHDHVQMKVRLKTLHQSCSKRACLYTHFVSKNIKKEKHTLSHPLSHTHNEHEI